MANVDVDGDKTASADESDATDEAKPVEAAKPEDEAKPDDEAPPEDEAKPDDEAPKADTSQTDTSQTDTSQTDTSQTDTSQTDADADAKPEDVTAGSSGTGPSVVDTPGAPATPDAGGMSKGTGRTVLIAGLAVLLVALLVVGTLLFLQHREANQQVARGQEALAVAQQVATDLTSLGAADAPAKISSLTQDSTGEFKSEITKYAAVVQSVLAQSKAGSTGTVSAAGLEKLDAGTASVLATVTASVTNDKQPQAQQLAYRLSIQLQRENDRWLVSGVTFVQ